MYLVGCEMYVVELYTKKVYVFPPLTNFAKNSIIDVLQDSKYSSKFSVFLWIPSIWEDPVLQVIGQNTLVQSYCKILWSISLKGMHQISLTFWLGIFTKQRLHLTLLFSWVCLGISSLIQTFLDLPDVPARSLWGIARLTRRWIWLALVWIH